MLKFHKKKFFTLLLLAAFIFFGIAAHEPKQDGFKNLKVLPKDISKDSLDAIMHHFTKSLGVKCNFCHAPNKDNPQGWPDFASDDKPEKDIARHMMKMTTDINKNYFNFNNSSIPDTIMVVSCYTCHRGNPHPEDLEMGSSMDKPPMGAPQGNMPPPPGNMPPGNMPPGNMPPSDSMHRPK